MTALRAEFDALPSQLPTPVRTEFERMGKRVTPDELCVVVEKSCKWRPLGLPELSALTGRTAGHLRTRILRRLLADGRVRYLYPDQPNHPHQKYTPGKEAP